MKMLFVPTPQIATVGVAPHIQRSRVSVGELEVRIPAIPAMFFLTLCPCCVLFFQVGSSEMKTLSLFFLLVASGACDDVKYISKRNSGRMKRLFVRCVRFLKRSTDGFLFVCFSIILFQKLFILSEFKDNKVSRLLINYTSFFSPSSCCQI